MALGSNRAGGSRKQDLFTHIKLTLSGAGLTLDEINNICTASWYNKNKTEDLYNILIAIKKIIAGDYTEEQFKECFGG